MRETTESCIINSLIILIIHQTKNRKNHCYKRRSLSTILQFAIERLEKFVQIWSCKEYLSIMFIRKNLNEIFYSCSNSIIADIWIYTFLWYRVDIIMNRYIFLVYSYFYNICLRMFAMITIGIKRIQECVLLCTHKGKRRWQMHQTTRHIGRISSIFVTVLAIFHSITVSKAISQIDSTYSK